MNWIPANNCGDESSVFAFGPCFWSSSLSVIHDLIGERAYLFSRFFPVILDSFNRRSSVFSISFVFICHSRH